jgi:hypothetical protein
MRRTVAGVTTLLATAGLAGIVAPPAQAAQTAGTPFELVYGASYWTGTVTFSNRSGTGSGFIHSVPGSGCVFASVTAYSGTKAYDTQYGQYYCNGGSGTIALSATAKVPGGTTSLTVGLWATASDGSNPRFVKSNNISR